MTAADILCPNGHDLRVTARRRKGADHCYACEVAKRKATYVAQGRSEGRSPASLSNLAKGRAASAVKRARFTQRLSEMTGLTRNDVES